MKKIIAIALAALMVLSLAGCGEKESTKTNLELVATLDQAILSLAAGKCDAVALDGTTAQRYVDQSDGAFAMSGINFDLEMYGIHEGNVPHQRHQRVHQGHLRHSQRQGQGRLHRHLLHLVGRQLQGPGRH